MPIPIATRRIASYYRPPVYYQPYMPPPVVQQPPAQPQMPVQVSSGPMFDEKTVEKIIIGLIVVVVLKSLLK